MEANITDAGIANADWIRISTDSGKMIIANTDVVERHILVPLYNTIQQGVHDRIKSFTEHKGNSYEKGRKKTATGFEFTISDFYAGSETYQNSIRVRFDNAAAGPRIAISGSIFIGKEDSKNMSPCTAKVSIEGRIEWRSAITITLGLNEGIDTQVQLAHTTNLIDNRTDSSKNACANMFSFFDDIIKRYCDISNSLTGEFFNGLVAEFVRSNHETFANIAKFIPATLLPQAGQLFSLINPKIDTNGLLSLEVVSR